ncbi:hypothetical protein [Nonomuraea sp. NPDC050786]|uniref:hypothetical protein n=1 Tax=Nonomuraea sp. NPDC050786 TaxID=3154840 RepID=UPI0033E61D79
MFDMTCRLLKSSPLVLLFDDLGQNLDGTGFLDPGFGEVFERLCQAADRGRVLATSRMPLPPAVAERLGTLCLGQPDLDAGMELAAGLPYLFTLDPFTRERVARTAAAHPRSLHLLDAWLSANQGGIGPRLAAVPPGAAPLGPVMADLTAQQREILLQAAISMVPVTAHDLAVGSVTC